ncbi:MAG TPA: hypothetical protein VF136_08545 [Methylomirabilota bacterium]
MAQSREIRSYDYVNHPYARVREALAADATGVFRAATRSAASRAHSVAAALHVNLAGLEVAREIALSVGTIEDRHIEGSSLPVTIIPVAWEAARQPTLFPFMSAQLAVYPLTSTETQLDFLGRYEPPLSIVGDVMNAVVGHRVAEASVHRFVADIAHYLREQLSDGRS